MRINITYINKLEFLYTFKKAFFTLIIKKNIQGGFTKTGLILHNLKRVIFKLDMRIRTLIPLALSPGTILPWVSQTLYNPREATS